MLARDGLLHEALVSCCEDNKVETIVRIVSQRSAGKAAVRLTWAEGPQRVESGRSLFMHGTSLRRSMMLHCVRQESATSGRSQSS